MGGYYWAFPGRPLAMLLVVSLVPFVCALFLFGYFFDRFFGKEDTPDIASVMHQMNQARIIPFPEPQPENKQAKAAGA